MRNYIYQVTCIVALLAGTAGMLMAQTQAQPDRTTPPPVVSSNTAQQNPMPPSSSEPRPQPPVNPDEDKPPSSQTTTMPSNTQPRGNAASQAQSQIEDALHRQVGAGNVTVSVAENNSIHLTGTVASDDEKKQAEQIAHAAAPDQTIVNHLTVSGSSSSSQTGSSGATESANAATQSSAATTPSASGEANESGQSAKLPQSDMDTTGSGAVRKKIEAGIKTEPSLADSSISIDTTDQSVDLKGDVSSQAAKNKALEIARANAGGRKVIDHLRVMSKPFWR